MGLISMGSQYVVTDLSFSESVMYYNGQDPTRVPVGPFDSQDEANDWAQAHIRLHSKSGGSWRSAPILDSEML